MEKEVKGWISEKVRVLEWVRREKKKAVVYDDKGRNDARKGCEFVKGEIMCVGMGVWSVGKSLGLDVVIDR